MEFGTIREPIMEGIYYPDDAGDLEEAVRGYLRRSATPAGNAFAVIVPHASYQVCGAIMASAFKSCVAREIRHIVIIAPYHRQEEPVVFLPESTWFRTALGLVPVHTDSIRHLGTCSRVLVRNDIPHLEEFSIEVQLPFLQYLFPRATIVPILVGAVAPEIAAALADALRTVYGRRRRDLLFVISANLTEYRDEIAARTETSNVLSRLACNDWRGILDAHAHREISLCGAGGVAAFLQYLPFPCAQEILARGSSRAAEGVLGKSVEYAAIAYFPTDPA